MAEAKREDATATAQAQSYAERAAALEATDGEFWKPEEGDSIGGKLTDIETGVGKNDDSTVYTIEDEAGNVISFWGSAILDKRLKKAEIDDVVLIKYLGKKTGKTGQSYKNYAVALEKGFIDDVPF